MEIIRGKKTSLLSRADLMSVLGTYDHLHIDIGTGDGSYVQHTAQQAPRSFVIGMDACRENLVKSAKRTPENALFVIGNAESLPVELYGLADTLTVNFPWGSLLRGLLIPESPVIEGLLALLRPAGRLEVRLNAGALKEAGWTLEDGTAQVYEQLLMQGFEMTKPGSMNSDALKQFPSTWAKRLAFGRDPRAFELRGQAALRLAQPLQESA